MALTLTSCARPTGEPPAGDAIDCALDGAAEFTQSCTAERVPDGIVLHRPDGGFWRIASGADGSFRAVDGADEPFASATANGMTELHIRDDRFRFRLEAPSDAPRP